VAKAAPWTPEAIKDVIWAMSRLLDQVGHDELSPESRQYSDAVKEWMADTEAALHDGGSGHVRVRMHPFPLTSPQLRRLEADIYGMVSQRSMAVRRGRAKQCPAELTLPRFQHTIEHLHASLTSVHWSSYLVLAALLGLLALNAVFLALLSNTVRSTIIIVNLVAIVAAIALWCVHHLYIRKHWVAFYSHAAMYE
jgi:hypothetical protein